MRTCTRCRMGQVEANYQRSNRTVDGLDRICRACRAKEYQEKREKKLAQKKIYYLENREAITERKLRHYEQNRGRVCASVKRYRDENPEKIQAYLEANRDVMAEKYKVYYSANRERMIQKGMRSHYLRKYGLAENQVPDSCECEICEEGLFRGSSDPNRKIHIDHSHSTGQVRGFLCGRCNSGLGKFREDPAVMAAAIRYLEEASSQFKEKFGHLASVKRRTSWGVYAVEVVRKIGYYRRRYGLDYLALPDEINCMICDAPTMKESASKQERTSVDHDHQTGAVRGFLCMACNLALGDFRENPDFLRAATLYLANSEQATG